HRADDDPGEAAFVHQRHRHRDPRDVAGTAPLVDPGHVAAAAGAGHPVVLAVGGRPVVSVGQAGHGGEHVAGGIGDQQVGEDGIVAGDACEVRLPAGQVVDVVFGNATVGEHLHGGHVHAQETVQLARA